MSRSFPSGVLTRMRYLALEYPVAGVASAVLPVGGFALPELVLRCAPLPSQFVWMILCLWFIGSTICMHAYDNARGRLQKLAQRLDMRVQIGRDLCFSSPELHAGYEQWRLRAIFWHVLDYLPVLVMVSSHAKISWWEECRASALWYEVWAMGLSLLSIYKLFNRSRLSASAYSWLSLTFNVYHSFAHAGALLTTGDPCFGRVGRTTLRGSVISLVYMSSAAYVMVAICAPVSQRYVPHKTVVSFLGGVFVVYLHMLYRDDGRVDPSADEQRTAFFWMFVATTLSCMACFHFSTRLTEAGMARYIAALRTHAVTRGGQQPSWVSAR